MSDIPVILAGEDAAKIYDALMHAMYITQAEGEVAIQSILKLTPVDSPACRALARALLIMSEAGAEIPEDEVPDCPEHEDDDHDCEFPILHHCANEDLRP